MLDFKDKRKRYTERAQRKHRETKTTGASKPFTLAPWNTIPFKSLMSNFSFWLFLEVSPISFVATWM